MSQNKILKGDNTGASIKYFYTVDSNLESNSISELITKIKPKNLTINNTAISHLLLDGVIPFPLTVFNEINILGVGDSLNTKGEISHKFPYFNNLSKETSKPDTNKLLKLLAESLNSKLANKSGTLMLSSGKDSVALALAVKEAGLTAKVNCVTYSDTADGEHTYAAKLSKKLGLKHQTVTLPTGEKKVRNIFESYFKNAPIPCADSVMAAYVLAVEAANLPKNTVVVDGMGNDIYVGHVPSPRDNKLYKFTLGNNKIFPKLRRLLPFNSKLNRFLQNNAELSLFGGGWLRCSEIKSFYPSVINTTNYWLNVTKAYSKYDFFDFRAGVRGRNLDVNACMLKVTNGCNALGHKAIFPWAEENLINYYFNLPEKYRFNREKGINKVLVRQLLAEKLDYNLPKKGFEFNSQKFLLTHKTFVIENILACKLWNKNIETELNKIFTVLEKDPRVGPTLASLFVVSGWYNHSKYLEKT